MTVGISRLDTIPPILRSLAASLLTTLLWVAPPAQAAPAPIVFDFEDGLQGWALGNSAQRVQTQILGGQWAIFGDGRRFEASGSMSIEMNLTDIASISVEMFLVDGDDFGLGAVVVGERAGGGGVIAFPGFLAVEPGNPSIRTIDVRSITGDGSVEIAWQRAFLTDIFPTVVAFIDNVTFHPVSKPSSWLLAPESSSWLYLSLGIAGMAMLRRKLASRASS